MVDEITFDTIRYNYNRNSFFICNFKFQNGSAEKTKIFVLLSNYQLLVHETKHSDILKVKWQLLSENQPNKLLFNKFIMFYVKSKTLFKINIQKPTPENKIKTLHWNFNHKCVFVVTNKIVWKISLITKKKILIFNDIEGNTNFFYKPIVTMNNGKKWVLIDCIFKLIGRVQGINPEDFHGPYMSISQALKLRRRTIIALRTDAFIGFNRFIRRSFNFKIHEKWDLFISDVSELNFSKINLEDATQGLTESPKLKYHKLKYTSLFFISLKKEKCKHFVSHNEGESWVPFLSNSPFFEFWVYSLDKRNECIHLVLSEVISNYYSLNGGITWIETTYRYMELFSSQSYIIDERRHLPILRFKNKSTTYAISVDGCRTWFDIISPIPRNLQYGYFYSDYKTEFTLMFLDPNRSKQSLILQFNLNFTHCMINETNYEPQQNFLFYKPTQQNLLCFVDFERLMARPNPETLAQFPHFTCSNAYYRNAEQCVPRNTVKNKTSIVFCIENHNVTMVKKAYQKKYPEEFYQKYYPTLSKNVSQFCLPQIEPIVLNENMIYKITYISVGISTIFLVFTILLCLSCYKFNKTKKLISTNKYI
ncbi:hypothetical protein A3Q56_05787 [Intoshia linei]|uniref:Uncharacterized protein n=1 Tax=Intoshia linei TaxID=1819745 RepID=A0A177AYP0_9BILA|nr:hypothetical protein A3Q56_05787 [Intoshia linei]